MSIDAPVPSNRRSAPSEISTGSLNVNVMCVGAVSSTSPGWGRSSKGCMGRRPPIRLRIARPSQPPGRRRLASACSWLGGVESSADGLLALRPGDELRANHGCGESQRQRDPQSLQNCGRPTGQQPVLEHLEVRHRQNDDDHRCGDRQPAVLDDPADDDQRDRQVRWRRCGTCLGRCRRGWQSVATACKAGP